MFAIYSMNCRKCDTSWKSRSKRKVERFNARNGGVCPKCGGRLSQDPIMPERITPPPEMKIIKRDITVIKL